LTIQVIKTQLLHAHTEFANYVASLDNNQFTCSKNNKWTPGQQMDHILRSVSPLNIYFGIPKVVIRMLFGKANRPSKDYDALVKKYILKLEAGGRAPARFVPKPIPAAQKQQLKNKLLKVIKRLCKQLDHFSEKDLDKFIMSHPLLGKLTLREMLYFTIYHVEHHKRLTTKILSS
jgi:DinB family protein